MRTDPDATAPESAPQTVIRYANRAGALVADTRDPRDTAGWDHAAACAGCLDAITPHHLDFARDWANTHAGQCRALPQPGAEN